MNGFHHTYNEFHLGDNLAHLHFLRGLARKYPGLNFVHAVHECHLDQLLEYVGDETAIALIPLELRIPQAINAWKNAGGYFERSPLRFQYWDFHLAWFRNLAQQMGLESPFTEIRQLLLHCVPALKQPPAGYKQWNVFVVNSRPCSGQLLKYDRVDYFDPLLLSLVAEGHSVLCTQPTAVVGVDCTETSFGRRLSLVEIGKASLLCDHHIMVATGPAWLALNEINLTADHCLHIVLLGNGERLDVPGLNILQVDSLEACREILVQRHMLLREVRP